MEQILDKCILVDKNMVLTRTIDGEVVFLSRHEKTLYELNNTASFIWERANGKTLIKTLIKKLAARHRDVDERQITKDVLEFIRQGLKKKFLILT